MTPDERTVRDERRFFGGMAVAAVAVVFAGFATSYYLWPITRATHYPAGQLISPSVPGIVHLHAIAFTAWVLLLAGQAGLVLRGHVAVHRNVGRLGAWLIPVLVLTGLLTAVQGARDGWNPGGPYRDAFGFMFVGIADIAVFTGFTAAGLAWRHDRDLHRRLIVLGTTGGLMWPAITRMPIVAGRFPLMFALLAALVLAPAARDLRHGARLRWVSLALGLGVLATFPLRAAVGNSDWWRAFAVWLVQ
jgi:hypothetical protein